MMQLRPYLIVFILNACGTSVATQDTTHDTVLVPEKKDSVQNALPNTTDTLNLGLTNFGNSEWVHYCLPLPLMHYQEDFTADTQKGEHVFKHKTEKNNILHVQGLMRDDTSVPLETYYQNSFAETEEIGKIILHKGLLANKQGFYFTGYWNNKIYEERFTEVVWFRHDEVIKLTGNYVLQDTSLWQQWLHVWNTCDAKCKE